MKRKIVILHEDPKLKKKKDNKTNQKQEQTKQIKEKEIPKNTRSTRTRSGREPSPTFDFDEDEHFDSKKWKKLTTTKRRKK